MIGISAVRLGTFQSCQGRSSDISDSAKLNADIIRRSQNFNEKIAKDFSGSSFFCY